MNTTIGCRQQAGTSLHCYGRHEPSAYSYFLLETELDSVHAPPQGFFEYEYEYRFAEYEYERDESRRLFLFFRLPAPTFPLPPAASSCAFCASCG